jgi:hypothetical protein
MDHKFQANLVYTEDPVSKNMEKIKLCLFVDDKNLNQ